MYVLYVKYQSDQMNESDSKQKQKTMPKSIWVKVIAKKCFLLIKANRVLTASVYFGQILISAKFALHN